MSAEYPAISIDRKTMNGKPVFEITVHEVVNFQTEFTHKLLCTVATFSLGSACVFKCAYCYVETIVRKHPEVVRLAKEWDRLGLKFEDVVVVRCQSLDIIREQLTIRRPRKVDLQQPGVVYSSPLVDCAAIWPKPPRPRRPAPSSTS